MPVLTRRRFLLGAAGAFGAAALGDAFGVEPTAIDVTRHDLPVPQLPPALAGVRIACVTDVHLSRGVPPSARALVARLAVERPDIVLLAGDICNRRDDLATLASWVRDARGSAATFATLGNWEHEAGIDRLAGERAYGRAGVELLYNSTARVTLRGAALTVVGIDDPVLGQPDLPRALAAVGAEDHSIWIVHAPGYVDGVPRDAAPRPAAILAGHTHGGQIRLPFYTPYTPTGSGRIVAGGYRDTIAPLYVARGIGAAGGRARLFCPPELPGFTLEKGQFFPSL